MGTSGCGDSNCPRAQCFQIFLGKGDLPGTGKGDSFSSHADGYEGI